MGALECGARGGGCRRRRRCRPIRTAHGPRDPCAPLRVARASDSPDGGGRPPHAGPRVSVTGASSTRSRHSGCGEPPRRPTHSVASGAAGSSFASDPLDSVAPPLTPPPPVHRALPTTLPPAVPSSVRSSDRWAWCPPKQSGPADKRPGRQREGGQGGRGRDRTLGCSQDPCGLGIFAITGCGPPGRATGGVGGEREGAPPADSVYAAQPAGGHAGGHRLWLARPPWREGQPGVRRGHSADPPDAEWLPMRARRSPPPHPLPPAASGGRMPLLPVRPHIPAQLPPERQWVVSRGHHRMPGLHRGRARQEPTTQQRWEVFLKSSHSAATRRGGYRSHSAVASPSFPRWR